MLMVSGVHLLKKEVSILTKYRLSLSENRASALHGES